MAAQTASCLEIKVEVNKPTLVQPAEATNVDEIYFLSNVDQSIPVILETIFCFKASQEMMNENPARVIKEALKRVLVLYYPLSGRLRMNSQGRFYIQCTGEGVVFVEADADSPLSDIGDITMFDCRALKSLVYRIPVIPNVIQMPPPLVAQVTRFKCGGFILGLAMNHFVFDALAGMDFLRSWTETARALPLSVPPHLNRTLLRARSPLKIEFPHLEFSDIENIVSNATMEVSGEKHIEYKCFTFGPEELLELKNMAMEDGKLAKCSAVQAVCAHVWRSRTMALQTPPNQQTRLLLAVDGRKRFVPPLPNGYFGNGVKFSHAICSAEELAEKPLSFGVGLVQSAINMVTDTYMRSAIDYLEVTRATSPTKNTLIISTWSHFSFHAIDFGWGEPVQIGPAGLPPELVLVLPHSNKRNTVNVVVGLPPRSMIRFQKYMRLLRPFIALL
eukprot:Gb_40003 [translate_table: standard]